MTQSDLEATFLLHWRTLAGGMPQPEQEYRFAPPRRFRLDLAFVDQKVAVELEGGVYVQGRHTRGKGYEKDCEKYNLAQSLGWSVYRFTAGMLDLDPVGCVEQVVAALSGEERLLFDDVEKEE